MYKNKQISCNHITLREQHNIRMNQTELPFGETTDHNMLCIVTFLGASAPLHKSNSCPSRDGA
jgi:hypothetical protein